MALGLALLRLSPTVAWVVLVEAVGLAVGLVVATAATIMEALVKRRS